MLCDDLEGWNGVEGWEAQKGGDICIHGFPSLIFNFRYIKRENSI